MEFMSSLGRLGIRPSFFELYMEAEANVLFRPALTHVLSVFAYRMPRPFLFLHNHSLEFYFVLMTMIEHLHLGAADASFSESFYGLKRVRVVGDEVKRLSSRDRRNALLCLVWIPYLKSKLDQWSEEFNPQSIFDFEQVQEEEREEEEEEAQPEVNETREPINKTLRQKLLFFCTLFFKKIYPHLNAGYKMTFLAYQIAYLFNITRYYSPLLHLIGQEMNHVTLSDTRTFDAEQTKTREGILENFAGSGILKVLTRWFIRRGFNFFDYFKYLLPMSIFFFKFLEWWYTTEYPKYTTSVVIPPPPQQLKKSSEGLEIPKEKKTCPICKNSITNPAMIPTGYVFCYPCIYTYLSEENKCPITFVETTTEQLRKLYVTS